MLAALLAYSFEALQPHGFGVEDTYTITSVMKLLPPAQPDTMTDAYQDAKVIGHDGDAAMVSITYFPLNDGVRKKRLSLYASQPGDLRKYLQPTATCNWDATMQRDVLKQLSQSGIQPPKTPTRQFVQQVADWAMQRSRFDGNPSAMPVDWYVSFQNGQPTVRKEFKEQFGQSKPEPTLTESQVFDRQLFGRQMFYAKCHGACTSSSIYLATIFRALGIPTRILYFVPPCDGNDPKQLQALSRAITNHELESKIFSGASSAQGFANHMFDEVWLGGRWVRLNYNALDQEIADENYLGLQTHIATCADIGETHLADTWGRRTLQWPNVQNRLSSINPYTMVSISDHWGIRASKANPPSQTLDKGTVIKTAWTGTQDFNNLAGAAYGSYADVMLFTKEWIPGRSYVQMREFINGASQQFLLVTPNHPTLRLAYCGLNCNTSTERAYGFKLNPLDAGNLSKGVAYELKPVNGTAKKIWVVQSGVTVTAP